MKEPSGKQLLGTLMELYAEQMGVKVTYQLVERKEANVEDGRPRGGFPAARCRKAEQATQETKVL